jgi:DNA mismatch repair protein MLH1
MAAGNQGTTITIEDLFYNVPIRLKALKLPTEEFQRIYDVVSRYAIHNYTVSFSLKKSNENNSIKTFPSSSPIENIRKIFGNHVANSLDRVEYEDESLKFKMMAYISNVSYTCKKGHFLLFINQRLVESKSEFLLGFSWTKI